MEGHCVALDLGRSELRLALPSDNAVHVDSAVLGYPRHEMRGRMVLSEPVVGHKALEARGTLRLEFPLRDGDADGMRHLVLSIFDSAGVAPHETHALVGVKADATDNERKELAAFMFEQIGVAGLTLPSEAFCALHSVGMRSGIVLDFGAGAPLATCVFEGRPVAYRRGSVRLSGDSLTKSMMNRMRERMPAFVVHEFRLEFGFVSQDPKSESLEMHGFALPDYTYADLGPELWLVYEIMFDCKGGNMPWNVRRTILAGMRDDGSPLHSLPRDIVRTICEMACDCSLQSLLLDCLWACDSSEQRAAMRNVMLTGLGSTTSGLSGRLQAQLGSDFFIRDAPMDAAVVSGGAKLVQENAFQNCWISRRDYEEMGCEQAVRKSDDAFLHFLLASP